MAIKIVFVNHKGGVGKTISRGIAMKQKKGTTYITLLCSSLLLAFTSTAHAYCFEEAGRTYNISPLLLWAIGKAESNFNPKAINWNSNGTFDFGVMQINSSWKKTLGDTSWQQLGNPCFNVKTGAWILAQCIHQHGYNWQAVGCYNSKTTNHQRTYSRRISQIITRALNDSAKLSRNIVKQR